EKTFRLAKTPEHDLFRVVGPRMQDANATPKKWNGAVELQRDDLVRCERVCTKHHRGDRERDSRHRKLCQRPTRVRPTDSNTTRDGNGFVHAILVRLTSLGVDCSLASRPSATVRDSPRAIL